MEDCMNYVPKMLLSRIELQDRQIRKLKRRLSVNTERVNDILYSKRHYLRNRAPGVLKRQQILTQAKNILRRWSVIPKLNVVTANKRRGKTNCIFLCTGNEARKLRAMVNLDFRQFNSRTPKKLNSKLSYCISKKRKK